MKWMLLFLGSLLSTATAHAAEAGTKEWAACAWASDRSAVEAWLAGPEPKWQTESDAPELLLGLRLIALCSDVPADDINVNRAPKWSKLRSTLARSAKGVSQDTAGVEALFCRNTADGLLYLEEVVRRTSVGDVIVYRQYFTTYGGQPVKLPQDLRVLPKEDTPKSRECSTIGSDGRLVPLEDEANA